MKRLLLLLMLVGVSSSTNISTHKVILTWTETSTNVTSYQIYRSKIHNGPYSRLNTVTVKTYTDRSMHAHTTYYYVVRAVAGTVVSPYSNEYKAVMP